MWRVHFMWEGGRERGKRERRGGRERGIGAEKEREGRKKWVMRAQGSERG